MRTGGVTLATAIEDTRNHSLRWFTMPQYHDEDAPASRSTRPLPFPHRCHLCRQIHPTHTVTFGLNVRLDLSGKAMTKSLCALCTKLLLKILGEGTQTVAVRVIRGDEGVGDIPGVRGGSGESLEVLRNVARLTQELRLKV